MTVGTDDLARMLIIEFASVYANDWYLQPIPLPAGALHTITQLTVSSSFNEPPEVLGPVAPSIPSLGSAAVGAPDWCLFRSTVIQSGGKAGTLNGLFVPPSVVEIQKSPGIEEVVLVRDDANDIGWAIEHTVLGADDRPLDRYAAAAQQAPTTTSVQPTDDNSTVRYLLETDVPMYCFPLVPDSSGEPRLLLRVLRRIGSDGQPHDVPPLGELLRALQARWLFDQELPLEGTTVRRRRYLVRGFAGEVLTWTGRERLIGGRFGSVPLAFDQVLSQ